MASEKILEVKKQEVASIADRIKRARGMVIVDYRGLTVAQDTALRNELRASKVEYKVLKNRLTLKALQQLGYAGLEQALNGPTAVAFSYDDPVAPSKILSATIKTNKKMSFKGGIIEGKVLDAKGIEAVASIPAKPVLVAQLLGMLTTPMRGLAVALSQIAEKKEQA